jgi:asparagine synthase (glutamine-hydrolysing)
MLFLGWKFALHDNDVVKINTMCALARVEVICPRLDAELVEFPLRMPAE